MRDPAVTRLLMLLISLSACTFIDSDPPGELSGKWSYLGINIYDSVSAVGRVGLLVSNRCHIYFFSSPILLDSNSTFTADGVTTFSTFPPEEGRKAHLTGRVINNAFLQFNLDPEDAHHVFHGGTNVIASRGTTSSLQRNKCFV